jgi:hypothetical protein
MVNLPRPDDSRRWSPPPDGSREPARQDQATGQGWRLYHTPATVKAAATLMWVWVVLESLVAAWSLVYPGAGADLPGLLISIVLWIWMAVKIRGGRAWARTTGTVLFAVDTIGLAFIFLALAARHVNPLFGLVAGGIQWLFGLATVILIWRRASSGYFF